MYRTADHTSKTTAGETKPAPTLVDRPSPPPEEVGEAPKRAATPLTNMTKEEIAALLAVTETNQLTKWARVGGRAKRAALPVMLSSTLLGWSLGTLASLIPVVLGIAYCAWPLVTQKKSGWT